MKYTTVGKGLIVSLLLTLLLGFAFFYTSRPVDTRTHEGDVPILFEGVPTTWKYDSRMLEDDPDCLQNALHAIMPENYRPARTAEGLDIWPGDVVYEARSQFLRQLTLIVVIMLFAAFSFTFMLYQTGKLYFPHRS